MNVQENNTTKGRSKNDRDIDLKKIKNRPKKDGSQCPFVMLNSCFSICIGQATLHRVSVAPRRARHKASNAVARGLRIKPLHEKLTGGQFLCHYLAQLIFNDVCCTERLELWKKVWNIFLLNCNLNSVAVSSEERAHCWTLH